LSKKRQLILPLVTSLDRDFLHEFKDDGGAVDLALAHVYPEVGRSALVRVKAVLVEGNSHVHRSLVDAAGSQCLDLLCVQVLLKRLRRLLNDQELLVL